MNLYKDNNIEEIYRLNRAEEEEFERFKKKLYIGLIILVVVVCLTSAVLYMYCITQTMSGYFLIYMANLKFCRFAIFLRILPHTIAVL